MSKRIIMLVAIIAVCSVMHDAGAVISKKDSVVVFRPSDATWYGSRTQAGAGYLNPFISTQWGFGLAGVGGGQDANQVPLLGDVNGDGIDDIVVLQNNGVGNYNWLAGHSTVSNGLGSLHANYPTLDSSILPFGNVAGNRGRFLADINGDGYMDAVTCNPDAYWHVVFSGATGLGGGAYQAGPGFYLSVDDKYLVGDFNGDGKDDICVVTPGWGGYNQWVIYKSKGNGSGFGTWVPDVVYGNFPASQAGDKFLAGDINGDGRDDAIVVRNWDGINLMWLVKYAAADGSVFGTAADTFAFFGLVGTSDTPFVADINGDGKKDIGVIRYDGTTGAATRYVSFTNLNGTLQDAGGYFAPNNDYQTFGKSGDISLIGKLGSRCVIGDYSGDCIVDFADFAIFAKNWLIDCTVTPGDPACSY